MPRIASPPIGGNTQDSLIRFPDRRSTAVRLVLHEDGWLVLGLRGHGWLHGDRRSALEDAAWLSRNLGLRVEAAA